MNKNEFFYLAVTSNDIKSLTNFGVNIGEIKAIFEKGLKLTKRYQVIFTGSFSELESKMLDANKVGLRAAIRYQTAK